MIVNVLSREAHGRIHIRGSVCIPKVELEDGRWKELTNCKEIITYCSGSNCCASKMAAEFLREKGFDAKAYEGGLEEWYGYDMPVEGSTIDKIVASNA